MEIQGWPNAVSLVAVAAAAVVLSRCSSINYCWCLAVLVLLPFPE